MHSVLRCIDRCRLLVAVLVLGLAGLLVAPVAHAQTAGSISCDMSGNTGCVSLNLPQGVSCQYLNSSYYCYDSGGSVGLDCTYGDGLNCSQTGTSTSASGTGGAAGNAPNGNSSSHGGGWLDKLTGWFANALHSVFQGLVDLLKDILVFFLMMIFQVVELIVGSISPPAFLKSYSMGGILGNAGPIVGFFISQFQVGTALALIGGAYAFRLLRKFVTLFQW